MVRGRRGKRRDRRRIHDAVPLEKAFKPKQQYGQGRTRDGARRRKLVKKLGPVCQFCGQRVPEDEITLEHVTPLGEGGTNDPTNLSLACYDCNQARNIGKYNRHGGSR